LSSEFEVRVPEEEIQSRSRTAMIQQADKMLQMGLIQSPAQYVRIADLPGSDDIIAGISPQIAKAKRQNSQMARGEIGNPEWDKDDDHDVHIEEHRAFMSTKRWEMLPEKIQKLFSDHVQIHKNFKAENQAKDIQMAGAQAMAEQAMAPVPEVGQEGMIPPPPQAPQEPIMQEGMEAPMGDDLGAMLGQG
jgi:hypothetical protein